MAWQNLMDSSLRLSLERDWVGFSACRSPHLPKYRQNVSAYAGVGFPEKSLAPSRGGDGNSRSDGIAPGRAFLGLGVDTEISFRQQKLLEALGQSRMLLLSNC